MNSRWFRALGLLAVFLAATLVGVSPADANTGQEYCPSTGTPASFSAHSLDVGRDVRVWACLQPIQPTPGEAVGVGIYGPLTGWQTTLHVVGCVGECRNIILVQENVYVAGSTNTICFGDPCVTYPTLIEVGGGLTNVEVLGIDVI